MDAILCLTLLMIGIVIPATYYNLSLCNAREELSSIKEELQKAIDAIEQSKESGSIKFIRPKNAQVRLLLNEYIKIYLQNRLEKRISEQKDIHLGRKPEIK